MICYLLYKKKFGTNYSEYQSQSSIRTFLGSKTCPLTSCLIVLYLDLLGPRKMHLWVIDLFKDIYIFSKFTIEDVSQIWFCLKSIYIGHTHFIIIQLENFMICFHLVGLSGSYKFDFRTNG